MLHIKSFKSAARFMDVRRQTMRSRKKAHVGLLEHPGPGRSLSEAGRTDLKKPSAQSLCIFTKAELD